MTVKTIIFDFDGTIADTLPKILELYNKYAEDFNLVKISVREAEQLRGKTAFEIIRFFGIAVIKIPFIANKIRSKLNNSITSIRTFPEIKKVIQVIKKSGFRLGILSTNSKENVEKFLEFNGVNIFDFVHSEKDLLGKSRMLGKIIAKQKLIKNETIYIGDEVRDIDACRDNGIKIISVTWGFNTKEILQKNNPDYMVEKPQEILKIVSS